jgi:hypothetical protein
MTIPYFILCPKPETTILWLGWYFSPKTMICTAAPKKIRKVVQTLEVKQANEWRNKKHNNLPKQLSWWSSQKLWSGKTWQHPFLCGRFTIQPGHLPLQAHSQSPPGDRRPTGGVWGVYFWKLAAMAILGVLFWGFTVSRSLAEVCLEVVFHGFPLVHFTWEFKDLLRLIPWSLDASGLIS